MSDDGPAIAVGRDAIQRLEADAPTRPGDLELFVADALARHLGGYTEAQEDAPGRTLVHAFLPAILPHG